MLKQENLIRNTELAKEYFQRKVAFTMGPVELKKSIDLNENIRIIDVRRFNDFEKGHIPGALSLPADSIEMHLNKLSKDQINIVYCYSQQCHAAAKSAIILAENGYPVVELEGGFATWKEYDMLIES